MIQRWQTVFLFLAAAGLTIQVFYPLFSAAPGVIPGHFQDGVLFTSEDSISMGLLILSGLIAIIAIFMYKQRDNQKKMIIGSMLVLLACVAAASIAFQGEIRLATASAEASLRPQVGLFMPVIHMVFLFLAYRYVVKDQKIIRSMDRLR